MFIICNIISRLLALFYIALNFYLIPIGIILLFTPLFPLFLLIIIMFWQAVKLLIFGSSRCLWCGRIIFFGRGEDYHRKCSGGDGEAQW
jgi:hypothetical protein